MRKNVSQAFEKLLLYLSQIERERNCQIITGSQNERKFRYVRNCLCNFTQTVMKRDFKTLTFDDFEEAYKFGMDILALFQDAMEKLPQRVVVHKRTPFKNDEIEGITNALKQAGISEIDLITITQEYDLKFIAEKIMYGQFLEDGYPVDRGTCIKLSSRNALLWTHGVVPSIQSNRRYYQGGRCIPAPLKITKYYGHGDLETIAKEILGFTKMNWNSFNLYTKLPATIDTSNTLAQVGNLLRQYNGVTYDYRFFI